MKNVSFYAEMPEHRGSKSASKAFPFEPWTRETLRYAAGRGQFVDVVATLSDTARLGEMNGNKRDVHYDAITVDGLTTVSDGYLRKRATRIDETLARRLCPSIFETLDRKA